MFAIGTATEAGRSTRPNVGLVVGLGLKGACQRHNARWREGWLPQESDTTSMEEG